MTGNKEQWDVLALMTKNRPAASVKNVGRRVSMLQFYTKL